MEISEHLKFRKELIEQAKEEDGAITGSSLISTVIPSLRETTLVESEDFENCYFENKAEKIKINGYSFNESGDRLQIYIVNEVALSPLSENEELCISKKSDYDEQFLKAQNFVRKAIKGHLNDEIQDSSTVKFLIHRLASSEGIQAIDVIEIFLITLTSSIEARGTVPYPKRFIFDKEEFNTTFGLSGRPERMKKSILIEKKIVDLNFLYDVSISNGNEYALIVDFENDLGGKIEVLKAADEENFETFLCVIPATILALLYRNAGGTRILEKNVRSFLQFGRKSVNAGMKTTIIKEPEKFIAFNNGLTITATDKNIEEVNGRLFLKSLTNFQIVNGGQTTATIFFSNKEGLNIDRINLMAKINVAKNITEDELESLISDISFYSNRQTKVSSVDNNTIKPQLDKIKTLSNSIITPSGSKWFFERLKGQFATKIRMAGGNKVRLEKEFPKERRFTKEILGKYYASWGDKPYLVKFGGDKVFGYFCQELAGDGDKIKAKIIDRIFYEELIAKMILVKELNKIYGAGKNSMGQLRAAVIPYSISVLYLYTNGTKTSPDFDLLKIWKNESLEKDLSDYFKLLMKLVNDLLKDKRYNNSDNTDDNTKKKEVWDNISSSEEIKLFMNNSSSQKIINKYGIKKATSFKIIKDVDFDVILETVSIISKGNDYYKKIEKHYSEYLTDTDKRKIEKYIILLKSNKDIGIEGVNYFNSLNLDIHQKKPGIFDLIDYEEDLKLLVTLSKIISIYNKAIDEKKEITSEFDLLEKVACAQKIKYASIINKIGIELSKGNAPTLNDVFLASNYFYKTNLNEKNEIKSNNVKITPELLQKMLEWNSINKSISTKEVAYITDFAYGFKSLNDFHIKNMERHYKIISDLGFSFESNENKINVLNDSKDNEYSFKEIVPKINAVYYIKKIINQDLERTPTFSVEAIRDFFNVELKHGECKVISIENLSSKNSFEVEFKLRETRNEYRIFLNDLFKEINPKEKDILIFRKKSNNSYTCEFISTNSAEYKLLDEQFEINKNHKLIVS